MSSPNSTPAIQSVDSNPVEMAKRKRICPVANALHWMATKSAEVKKQVDQMGAEVNQRQDKMRFLNSLITDINSLTDDKNTLDITGNPEIVEKLRVVREELEIKMPETKLKFNQLERDRLIENLHLSTEGFDKENKTQTQKIDIMAKLLDQVMTILKSLEKEDKQTKHSLARALRGG